MSPAESLSQFARERLEPILDRSGRLLYSSAATLRPGDLYLLGHNPGGATERHALDTVRRSIDALPRKTTNDYLDESWSDSRGRAFPPGSRPLQRRVAWLLGELGYDIRAVAASNAVFVRSRDAHASSFQTHAELCWTVHERILAIVEPKFLVVFGNSDNSPYTFLRERFKQHPQHETSAPSGHGDWVCRSFVVPGRFRVIGLPHLSRYNIIGKIGVVNWIKSYLCR